MDLFLSRYHTSIQMPEPEPKKEEKPKKPRVCLGCQNELLNQEAHMGGCLPDYDETWSDLES
jgi:hypothetical protein